MLPYSLRKNYLSFTDKKWDWKYLINNDGNENEKNPILSELKPSGVIKEYKCEIREN